MSDSALHQEAIGQDKPRQVGVVKVPDLVGGSLATQDGHTYDPAEVLVPDKRGNLATRKSTASRSPTNFTPPTQLSKSPSPLSPSQPIPENNPSSSELKGNEELDQARLFNLYLDLHGARSVYEVAKRFHVREDFVERLRVHYGWDEQVKQLEDEDAMAGMEETSLNEAILLQNDMVLAIKNRINDNNEARKKLKDGQERSHAQQEALGMLLMKPQEMIRLAEKVMEIKGQATANIRRRPGKIFVGEDPQRMKELQEKYAKMRMDRQRAAQEDEQVEELS